MRRNCCTCLTRVDEESASILTMGAYGTPKCLCEECATLVDTITLGRDYDEITSAMEKITEKMSAANIDDRVTVSTMTELLRQSAERAQKIKDGEYDFSSDEPAENECFEEIPEELQETEEDRLLDEKDAAASAKFDKVLNIIWIVVGSAAGAYLIWRLIDHFLIK